MIWFAGRVNLGGKDNIGIVEMSRESLIDKELDEEFIKATIIIQNTYENMVKHDQVKVEAWIAKLAKISVNAEWKKNRNVHIHALLDCVLEKKLAPPFDKLPPAGNLAPLKAKSHGQKLKASVAGKLMKTEEIEKIIEANLMSIKDEEVFELSPRDTCPNKAVKFDTSTVYEITPSKSNRYRTVRESAAVSKRDGHKPTSSHQSITPTAKNKPAPVVSFPNSSESRGTTPQDADFDR